MDRQMEPIYKLTGLIQKANDAGEPGSSDYGAVKKVDFLIIKFITFGYINLTGV